MKFLRDDIDKIKPFISAYGGEFSDLTVGARFMWGDDLSAEYEIVEDTLILRETYDGKRYFYYPLGENTDAAFSFAEKQAKSDGEALRFCALSQSQCEKIKNRYPFSDFEFLRDWSDYVYTAQQFTDYAGKKLSGQRNHVNKFNRNYPDYKVNLLQQSDISKITAFLDEYERESAPVGFAKEEEIKARALLNDFVALGQFGIYITVGGKVVSLSVGEKVKDTLFVHIEKGLKSYEGVYPKTAQEFAKTFACPEIRFINREEDCGDAGLRTSKTQYRPIEIKTKYFTEIKTAFDRITPPVYMRSERLTVEEIVKDDAENYRRLYTDDDNNKYWGYDYKEDLKDKLPTKEYFFNFMQGLKEKKEEYSLAVKSDGKMIGEIVLWNFGYNGEVETGFRFFKEYQGKGYATESLSIVLDYEFKMLGVPAVRSRCNKKNTPSFNLLNRCGFIKTHEDENYFYFVKRLTR